MPIEISILSTNEYLTEEIIREEIPEKYLYDENGDFLFTSTILPSDETVSQLIHFLLQGNQRITEVYKDNQTYVLDLTQHRNSLIDFDYLENNYSNWLTKTGRENTMNEYGMLVDIIGNTRKGLKKKYLLMIVSKSRDLS